LALRPGGDEDVGMTEIAFRPALANEAAMLGELALRSKASWGYDQDFIEACRAELAFRPEEVAARRIVVAESPAGVLGFYSVDGRPPEGELGNMWVVPESIGTGIGRRLWRHAIDTARAAGFTALRIESEPHAEGFYRAMGAHRVGEAPSGSIPGRTLPLMLIRLTPTSDAPGEVA
jgi:GNAT superfamily N-acetyltransferase